MYIVYSQLKAKSRHLTSLERPEECEATGCRLVWLHAIHKSRICGQHTQLEMNFVWPKIVPNRRRCPLVRRPDKGGFTVLLHGI